MKFLAVTILTAHAFAQIQHGTLAVVYFSNEKIAVAADSRVTFTGPGIPPDDTICKIAALHGQAVFVTTGASGYTGDGALIQPWSNLAQAYVAYDQVILGSPRGNIQEIAEVWAVLVQSKFGNLAVVHPDKIIEAAEKGKGVLATAFIAGFGVRGELVLFQAQVTATGTKLGHQVYLATCTSTRDFCAGGETGIFLEFLNPTTPRAMEESRKWKPPAFSSSADYDMFKAMRFVELTEMYRVEKDVGGPIDAVQLNKSGTMHWYDRKKNCPEN